jgi:hypothetical protein
MQLPTEVQARNGHVAVGSDYGAHLREAQAMLDNEVATYLVRSVWHWLRARFSAAASMVL